MDLTDSVSSVQAVLLTNYAFLVQAAYNWLTLVSHSVSSAPVMVQKNWSSLSDEPDRSRQFCTSDVITISNCSSCWGCFLLTHVSVKFRQFCSVLYYTQTASLVQLFLDQVLFFFAGCSNLCELAEPQSPYPSSSASLFRSAHHSSRGATLVWVHDSSGSD